MNNTYSWYSMLIKPMWAPPSWVFGPVWTVLYAIIAITYGAVFYRVYTGELSRKIAIPFALNLVFNFAFIPLQFGLKNNLYATIDIVLVFATLAWALVLIRPYAKWIAYANIPYFFWVSFATALQLVITYLNG